MQHIPKQSAPGIDGITQEEASKDFANWSEEMLRAVHRKVQAACCEPGMDTQTR
ncbi:hypothetical protein [Caldalkalibacillus thermarum]|uniref:hypothetical protein n=1 Tax=Caldalkalibacillus thermarum TaxID=296745 RepID=UPI001FD4E43C|nr:hypothetical protein [Caldalkalibacillus thermarum]